jgi:hypothetical protein
MAFFSGPKTAPCSSPKTQRTPVSPARNGLPCEECDSKSVQICVIRGPNRAASRLRIPSRRPTSRGSHRRLMATWDAPFKVTHFGNESLPKCVTLDGAGRRLGAIQLPAKGHFNDEKLHDPRFGFSTSGAGVRIEIGTPAEAKPVHSRSKPGARPVPTGFAPEICTGFAPALHRLWVVSRPGPSSPRTCSLWPSVRRTTNTKRDPTTLSGTLSNP